jgi:hypothetical protein
MYWFRTIRDVQYFLNMYCLTFSNEKSYLIIFIEAILFSNILSNGGGQVGREGGLERVQVDK